MMTVEELRRALEQGGLGHLFLKDTGATGELEAFYQLLTEYSELSLSEFCVKARDGLKKKSKIKIAVPNSLPRQSPVVRYLNELKETKTDTHQFERVVGRMKKDKEIRIGEAREVAMQFVGGTRIYKTKADAFKAILQRQISDIRAANKLDSIADIF
jgi:hypothetical protein